MYIKNIFNIQYVVSLSKVMWKLRYQYYRTPVESLCNHNTDINIHYEPAYIRLHPKRPHTVTNIDDTMDKMTITIAWVSEWL